MNRESILSANTITIEPVDAPLWGGTVHVKNMNAVERVHFYDALTRIDEGPEYSARVGMLLLVFTLCDPAGNLLLKEPDVDELIKHDGDMLNKLCGVANRVNRIGEGAGEKKSAGKPVPLLDAAGVAVPLPALPPDAGSAPDHAG